MKKQFSLFSLAVCMARLLTNYTGRNPLKIKENPPEPCGSGEFLLEQGTGIEPASSAWEADVLPMY